MPQNDKAKNVARFHGITPGTVTANKALVVDSNKNLSGLGTVAAGSSLTLTDTGGAADFGPKIKLHKNDQQGYLSSIESYAYDSGNNDQFFTGIYADVIDGTNGSEDAEWWVDIKIAGVQTTTIWTHPTSGVYLLGATDGSSANGGQVGQIIDSGSVSQTTANNTYTNITSISLTAGDWDIYGAAVFDCNLSAGTAQQVILSCSPTSATINSSPWYSNIAMPATILSAPSVLAPTVFARISSTTTYYLVGYVINSSAGNTSVTGRIWARRRR